MEKIRLNILLLVGFSLILLTPIILMIGFKLNPDMPWKWATYAVLSCTVGMGVLLYVNIKANKEASKTLEEWCDKAYSKLEYIPEWENFALILLFLLALTIVVIVTLCSLSLAYFLSTLDTQGLFNEEMSMISILRFLV